MICGPWARTAAFPMANPPGWYTNTYWFAWQYPWFAYYNYSQGPYANWMPGGGFASYANYTGHPITYAPWVPGAGGLPPGPVAPTPDAKDPKKDPVPKDPTDRGYLPGKVMINVPADAKVLFNGTVAEGTGSARTFATPPLQTGTLYGYELTAEVIRNGKVERVTERVIVRAGETANVSLNPGAIQTVAK
jgi:uncharacterized protein (TIGR03000 family)